MKKQTVVFVLFALVVGLMASAFAQAQQTEDLQSLQKIVLIKSPQEKATALKQFLKDYPDSRFGFTARGLLFQTLAALPQTPEAELVAAGEDYVGKATAPTAKANALNTVAWELAKSKRSLDKARQFSEEALKLLPANVPARSKAAYQDTLGYIYFQQGDYAKALEWLKQAAENAGGVNDGEIVFHLAQTQEKLNQTDDALASYLKVAGAFFEDANSKEAETAYLRIGQSKRRSAEELKKELAARKKESLDRLLKDARLEKVAPAWELPTLEGSTAKLSDHAGKIVVLDWWGSWCPPCRAELPHFQALYSKYKDRVVFLGMNWEQPTTPDKVGTAKKFMADNKYTFPVILDHQMKIGESYGVRGFPTVFIVDAQGKIRYQNVGYRPGVEKLLEAQIEEMLSK
jgi:thiol-disulfide isomerase/thioredoxin